MSENKRECLGIELSLHQVELSRSRSVLARDKMLHWAAEEQAGFVTVCRTLTGGQNRGRDRCAEIAMGILTAAHVDRKVGNVGKRGRIALGSRRRETTRRA